MDELIEEYLTNHSVFLVEMALEKLVAKTTEANYLEIISKIEKFPNSTEIDVAMYIHDIAKPNYVDLKLNIQLKKLAFKDKDAIEELDFALLKIQKK
ncbi:hypothetical protein SAMN05444411_101875 [Lutibacter oricola]|uniref:Uncharacterized protein n=1 Tax=Lutibacter oricola TaxID=762486 RepID=A0A1H2U2P9_9FLAO|nr:hypothetical protein [Lutibacter oricola]SDW50502.1 hypothetical protein SAMN05444411_101875 [Lutibacter oricola]